jgi:hypothetical protein
MGRQLGAQYSMELAQDLKAIHGLDAESELTNDISAELISEINREIVRTVYITAVPGAQYDTTTAGIFDLDTDSNGRWSAEKWKGLYFQVERDANIIAKRPGAVAVTSSSSRRTSRRPSRWLASWTTRRWRLTSRSTTPVRPSWACSTASTRSYVDPYAPAGFNYYVAGYKGATWTDAGLFYCPYVPITMVRAVDPNTFQPSIGFKTRYGMVANPYAEGLNQGLGVIRQDSNKYYRRVLVTHLM